MPRACTICNHPKRKIIDAMVANKDPYLRIAEKFGLNSNTVTSHGKKHVLPFIAEIEQQANAAVLERVMAYRDIVNLPLPEKSKHVENKLWDDYEAATTIPERMTVVREIQKQQAEQARLAGDYTKDQNNAADNLSIAKRVVKELLAQGKGEQEAVQYASGRYGVLEADLVNV